MTRTPETKPGHLKDGGPLISWQSERGSRKSKSAHQFQKAVKERAPRELGWKKAGEE